MTLLPPEMTLPPPERQELELRLDTLVEMAQRMPEDEELATLIRVVRKNIALNETHPETTEPLLINTINLADFHIQQRQPGS